MLRGAQRDGGPEPSHGAFVLTRAPAHTAPAVEARRPFDPSRIRGPRQPAGPTLPGLPLSVTQVNELVGGALAAHVPGSLAVAGEIGDFARAGSGHLYFTLKDARSELRCVMWRSSAATLKWTPQSGLEVIARGGLEVYVPRGSYQLVVRALEPRGVGALELAFRQLREKLAAEGLLDPARKRPIPRFPERVALVTSPRGAAIRDILRTFQRRWPALDVLVFPVRVQGEGAAGEVAAAISLLNEHADALGGIDVIIVARGGGSLEDLWAFNEEAVARAVAGSRIPIVSGVGHEVDVTICDLVADLRAATPTAAAELVTPNRPELAFVLAREVRRAERALAHHMALARGTFGALMAREPLARPMSRVREQSQRLDELVQRAAQALRQQVAAALRRLSAAESGLWRFRSGARFAQAARAVDDGLARAGRVLSTRLLTAERELAELRACFERRGPAVLLARHGSRLEQVRGRLAAALRLRIEHGRRLIDARLQAAQACDPRRVLQRGYSLTRDARTRRIIRSIAEIHGGQRLVTQVGDGEFRSTADDPRQPGLFD